MKTGTIMVLQVEPGKETSKRHLTATRSSSDPSYDTHLMLSFLELENAAARRRVDFKPHTLGGVVIVSPHASYLTLFRDLLRAMREARENTGRIGWRTWL